MTSADSTSVVETTRSCRERCQRLSQLGDELALPAAAR